MKLKFGSDKEEKTVKEKTSVKEKISQKKEASKKEADSSKKQTSLKGKLKNFSFKKMDFYKKKKFYIILVIVFSVLLVLDLGFGLLARSMGGGRMGNNSQSMEISENSEAESSEDGDLSSGDFSGEMGQMPSDGEMPDMGDSEGEALEIGDMEEGEMPEGDLAPGDAGSSEDSEGESSEEGFAGADSGSGGMPSGGDFDSGSGTDEGSQMASSDTGRSGSGFINWFGKAYLIIAIVLALLDAASIVSLVCLTRKQKKKAKETQKAQAREEGKVFINRPEKKEKKHPRAGWIIAVAVIVVIVLLVNLISRGSSSEASQTEASDLSGTVETGTIETTVPGTGTLESEDAVDMSFAGSVTVTKWYVSNGDSVEEGDTIARVDKTSALSAIVTLQEAIDSLDSEIASHEDDEISDTITATSSGRIKAIYASEGTAITDTMYEYSALMVISLDGLMAVDIETDELEAGDSVTVTLSDGTEESGQVESVTNSVATITLTDEGTDIDDSVTVYDSDGNEIGTGTLYVHSALNVTGFSGTVSGISVSEEEEVSSGDTLMTLTDTEYTAEYESLVEERSELAEEMAELFEIYETGYLYAETSGVISGVDESLTEDEDSDEDSEDDEDSDDEDADEDSDEDKDSEEEDTEDEEDSDDEDTDEDEDSEDEDSDDAADADSTSLNVSSEEIAVSTVYSGSLLYEGEDASGTNGGSIDTGSSENSSEGGGSSMDSASSESYGSSSSSGAETISSSSEETESSDTSSLDVSETTLCTITPQDYMTVEITVDEQDILSLEVGQSAEVTLDAIAGQSFEGEVISVNLTSSNSGGNSKYTAVIQIEKSEDMLSGMNASVEVVIDSVSDVLIVCAEALFEEDGSTWIYTSFNERKGTYSDAVEVTTGASDGEYVEITDGLSEGDTYYYSSLDTVNYSSSTVSGNGNFNMGSAFGR